MQNRATEDHKIWLFDLAHGNLTDEKILKGFVKYYVLNGFTVENVQDDIIFRTHYNPVKAMETLKEVLQRVAKD
jgi:hypothetical protein